MEKQEPREQQEALSDEELEHQDGEELPEREAMSVITPAGEPNYEIVIPPPRD